MGAAIIRGLTAKKKEYEQYKTPFDKAYYLENVELMVNGQVVKPTEENVDKCLAYMEYKGEWICEKTVRTTVKEYLNGRLDVSIPQEITELERARDEKLMLEKQIKEAGEAIRKADQALKNLESKTKDDIGE